MSNPIFDGLNTQQREAVEVLSGPLLILAGAGSGKTKCLTHRIANLMANGVAGDQILAVTFTNKAANEMKGRVEKLLAVAETAPSVAETASFQIRTETSQRRTMPAMGTFHATCVRILRQDIEQMDGGITRNFVIFDSSDSQSLIKLLMKEMGYDPKELKFKAVLSHISGAKNQLITPTEYAHASEPNRFTRAVSELYPLYQKRLQEHNALDFDDLLQKTVELFELCPEVLKKYKSRWQHLLIDEYQDTNFAQYRFVRLPADDHQNLCVIGDDHQSIYSFRGADYTNILNFEKDFPAARVVKLEQNYRSTGNILNCANTLIAFNQTGHPKNLWTENSSGDKVFVRETENERDEGNAIADTITDLVRSGARHSDCAVLYRMNAQSRALEEAFMRRQIPYQIVGGTRFFDRREIKDIVAYLRLIFNPRDDVAFLRVINVPARKLGPATLDTLKQYAEHYTLSMLEVLENVEDMEELAESKRVLLKGFRKLILELRAEAKQQPISILLDHLIDRIEYRKYLDDGTSEGESRIQNVQELFSVAARYDGAEDSLASFLEGVALVSDIDRYDDASDAVTLMTIHASKGLEFPVVFLPGWEDGIFPSSSAQFEGDKLEEERRLGYVALTRAKEKCTLTHARSRMLFGKTEFSSPSKFLEELDEECTNRVSLKSKTGLMSGFSRRRTFDSGVAKAREAIFSSPPSSRREAIFGVAENTSGFQIGARVRHADFGEGTIVQINGDVLSVAFKGEGVKRIVGSVAPIEVIAE
ncbi:UvrD-helicase domain-containing protein [Candidatus Gracilibacteria bacterium]|nr:UvrD-helicase domain-containing protein [Candidatus Gracilibacteria bacterium]